MLRHVAAMGLPTNEDIVANMALAKSAARVLPQSCAHNGNHTKMVSPASVPFELGAYELGQGCYCYLQPEGQWGFSNSGLVVSEGDGSLLIDTFFDLRLTERLMLGYAAVTRDAPIGTLVNTHMHADHVFGNQVVAEEARKRGVELDIVQTEACAGEFADMMQNDAAGGMESMRTMHLGPDFGPNIAPLTQFQSCFSPFDWKGVQLTPATSTFSGNRTLGVGRHRDADTKVELFELGPAHTKGDLVAWVPHSRTLYAGDLLFIGGTPIVWVGPTSGWIAACDRMLELNPEVVVPGHGRICGVEGIRDVKAYLEFVTREARGRFDAGMDVVRAAKDIDLGHFKTWTDAERIAVNVDTLYREWGAKPAVPEGMVDHLYHWHLMAEVASTI